MLCVLILEQHSDSLVMIITLLTHKPNWNHQVRSDLGSARGNWLCPLIWSTVVCHRALNQVRSDLGSARGNWLCPLIWFTVLCHRAIDQVRSDWGYFLFPLACVYLCCSLGNRDRKHTHTHRVSSLTFIYLFIQLLCFDAVCFCVGGGGGGMRGERQRAGPAPWNYSNTDSTALCGHTHTQMYTHSRRDYSKTLAVHSLMIFTYSK